MKKSTKGVSIISREAAEERRQFYMKKKEYWEKFEQKAGLHIAVKNLLFKMQEESKEFLMVPRLLGVFFLLYLNKFHPSQQNMQRALNTTRVFFFFVHQFQKSINKFNMKTSFFVSPSIWEKWLIGRKAKESGIEILKKMGVLISYRYNRKKKMSIEEPRFVIMYQFNLQKVKWLYDCVRMVAIRDEAKQVDR